jgi:hypothetical protein
MTALVCLVAIEVSDDVLLAVSNRHLLAFRQTDALVALLPFFRRLCRRKGNHYPTPDDQIILLAKS